MAKKRKNEKKKKANAVDKQYRRMEASSKFWSRFDPANKFRHWYLGVISVTRSLFRVTAAWQTIAILLASLTTMYIMAAFYTGRGEFVVKLDRPLADSGFLLSETQDFGELLITLRNDAVEDVTNITLEDIPRDVMDVDGKHNGRNYVAYTFYLKNKTGGAKDYKYELKLLSASKKAETATWVMLFHNGKQEIYAQENVNGYPESLYRKWEIPFMEYAADEAKKSAVVDGSKAHMTAEVAEYHELTGEGNLYQAETVPWESGDMVCTGTRKGMMNEEVDKFTIVIWLEGDDPDCTDDLFGGHIEMSMLFTY